MLSSTEIVPGNAAALEIRTDGGYLTLINVHGLQAGCSPLAGRAAFWGDIQMYATARSLGGRHPVVIAGDTNVYMDATSDPATEHFCAGWGARGLRGAMAGGEEDMTPTLHPSRHRVDTFLVNEPLLPWSLRESVWARGMPGDRPGPPPGPPGLAGPPQRSGGRGDAHPLQQHGGPPPPVRRRGHARPTLPVGGGHRRAG